MMIVVQNKTIISYKRRRAHCRKIEINHLGQRRSGSKFRLSASEKLINKDK